MYSFEFKSKLKRLNPRLFVGESAGARVNSDWRSVGIYLKTGKREDRKSDYSQVSGETRRYIEDIESGNRPEFIIAIPADWIPEFDRFEGGKVVARGWRTVLASLVRRNFISLARAKRVFGCNSLGESDYDRSTFDERAAL